MQPQSILLARIPHATSLTQAVTSLESAASFTSYNVNRR